MTGGEARISFDDGQSWTVVEGGRWNFSITSDFAPKPDGNRNLLRETHGEYSIMGTTKLAPGAWDKLLEALWPTPRPIDWYLYSPAADALRGPGNRKERRAAASRARRCDALTHTAWRSKR